MILVSGGTGFVGAAVACELSRRGIACLLVERNPTTTRHPKMDITNARSMELFRRLGVVDALRAVAVPPRAGDQSVGLRSTASAAGAAGIDAVIHLRTRSASPIREYLPVESRNTMIRWRPAIFACMTRQRPASEM